MGAMMKKALTFLALLLYAANAQAAPSQPTVTGTVTHNGVVTLGGSGFGSKSPVAPMQWDPVDGNYTGITNGGVVPTGPGYPWMDSSGEGLYPVHFKTTNPRGKFTAKYTNTGTANGEGKAGLGGNNYPGAAGKTLYTSWWMHLDKSGCIEGNSSNKWTRFVSPDGWVAGLSTIILEPEYMFYYNDLNGDVHPYDYGNFCGDPGWTRMEEVVVNNPPSGNAPATYVAMNNEPRGSQPFAPFSLPKQITYIGCIGFDGSNTPTASQPVVDWGEVYVDNTRARVEICNNSVKASADHCEIQIPQNTWNDNQIQIKVNQGSFSDGASAYLFVVNDAGTASPGKLISFSGTAPVVNGLCGNESAVVDVCPTASCIVGAPGVVTKNASTCTWACAGSGGGTTDYCSAPISFTSTNPSIYSWESSTKTVSEDGGVQIVGRIVRTGDTSGAGQVSWQTDGYPDGGMTADGRSDYYGHGPVAVSFAAGETYKDVTMEIWTDSLVEGTETTKLTLSAPSGDLGSQYVEILSITDGVNTPPPPLDLPPIESGTIYATPAGALYSRPAGSFLTTP